MGSVELIYESQSQLSPLQFQVVIFQNMEMFEEGKHLYQSLYHINLFPI